MLLIINADDLGISREVNDAIFGLMAEGKITSATILASGPAVEDAAKRLGEFPQCSFGVHLNLTEFKPVSASPSLECVRKSGSGVGVSPAGGVPPLFSRARRPPSQAGGPRHYFPDTLLEPILNGSGDFAGNIRAVPLTPGLREELVGRAGSPNTPRDGRRARRSRPTLPIPVCDAFLRQLSAE